jgi:predicted DNA-binding transcriptional regulator AlpA
MSYEPSDPLLTSEQAAIEVGLSEPGFWKAVSQGRLPAAYYPLPRSARWRRSELRAAVEATRMRPADQHAARRAAKVL